MRRNRFQALAKHLATLAERRARDRFKGADPARKGRFPGRQLDDAGGDFRRRHEGRRRHVEENARFGPPAAEDTEAAVILRVGSSATIRSATSRWNMSVNERHQGGQSARGEPAGEKAVPTL